MPDPTATDSAGRKRSYRITGIPVWLLVVVPAGIGWVEIVRWVIGGLFS